MSTNECIDSASIDDDPVYSHAVTLNNITAELLHHRTIELVHHNKQSQEQAGSHLIMAYMTIRADP